MNTLAKSQAEESTLQAVSLSNDVMWGQPVFRGTRVPIETVLGSIDIGMSLEQIKESFPFITKELVEAARTYTRMHPPPGPPRGLGELNPHWKLISRKVFAA